MVLIFGFCKGVGSTLSFCVFDFFALHVFQGVKAKTGWHCTLQRVAGRFVEGIWYFFLYFCFAIANMMSRVLLVKPCDSHAMRAMHRHNDIADEWL